MKQRLDFQVRKLLNFIDRLTLNQGQKTAEKMFRFSIKRRIENFETTLRISSEETIKSMNRLAIIQNQKIVETTVRFSIK